MKTSLSFVAILVCVMSLCFNPVSVQAAEYDEACNSMNWKNCLADLLYIDPNVRNEVKDEQEYSDHKSGVVLRGQDGEIYVAVEQQAEFPGGVPALMNWLANNIRYPESAQKNKEEGRVIVRFVIEKDGSIGQVAVAKGVSEDLDQEAVRVAKMMPKWIPGKNNGTPVRSFFTLPITFRLTVDTTDESSNDNSQVK